MNCDLIIVGAGPAGVSAAIEARWHGLSVLLLDENAAPGGRIWQALEARGAKDADDDATRCASCRRFVPARRTPIGARPSGRSTRTAPSTGARTARPARRAARFVLLATGTTERPLPIPGWTLPGVMTVGAAQIALKTAGLVPTGKTWMAGQGPLLLLYAVQALRAGGRFAGRARPVGCRRARWAALRHLPRAARALADSAQGPAVVARDQARRRAMDPRRATCARRATARSAAYPLPRRRARTHGAGGPAAAA